MTVPHVFDRLHQFDPASRLFGIMPHLERLGVELTVRPYTWSCSVTLDQGNVGACVGFGWGHENAARPVVRHTDNALAMAIYNDAHDIYPGRDGGEGSSVLAGAKVMQQRKLLKEYRWGFGLNDTLVAGSRHGPVVLGLDWWTGMMEPDENGYIHPTGRIEGGHCILMRGVSVAREAVLLHNSWGPHWGGKGGAPPGTAWLRNDGLGLLLEAQGEACIPVKR